MSKTKWGRVFVACLASFSMAADGGGCLEEPAQNNGSVNNGVVNNGNANNGATNNGTTNNGATNNGFVDPWQDQSCGWFFRCIAGCGVDDPDCNAACEDGNFSPDWATELIWECANAQDCYDADGALELSCLETFCDTELIDCDDAEADACYAYCAWDAECGGEWGPCVEACRAAGDYTPEEVDCARTSSCMDYTLCIPDTPDDVDLCETVCDYVVLTIECTNDYDYDQCMFTCDDFGGYTQEQSDCVLDGTTCETYGSCGGALGD